MRDYDLELAQAADALAYCTTRWADARRVMRDQHAGYPSVSGGFGAGGPRTLYDEHGNTMTATGPEAAALTTNHDPAREAERHALDLIGQLYRLAGRLEPIVAQYAPTIPTPTGTDPEVGIDWCESCHRIDLPGGGHRCEPVARRDGGKGEPYYKGLCQFCGRFRAAHGVLPPLTVLRSHHAGRRLNAAHVDREVKTERARLASVKRAGRKAKNRNRR